MSSKFRIATVGAMMMFASAVPTFAQNQGGGGGNGGGGGGRGGNPQQWRQQMEDRLKQALGTTDDEYTALQPKIEKVQQLQRDAMGGMFGRGRRGQNQDQGNQSATQTATADLRKTLDDKEAKPEDIKSKLEALRAAKVAAKAELVKAQEDLKGVLTQRQEAVMVEWGMLD